jgi:hypothetical protein
VVRLVHTRLGSSCLIEHVLHCPPPQREELCHRSCSNKQQLTIFRKSSNPVGADKRGAVGPEVIKQQPLPLSISLESRPSLAHRAHQDGSTCVSKAAREFQAVCAEAACELSIRVFVFINAENSAFIHVISVYDTLRSKTHLPFHHSMPQGLSNYCWARVNKQTHYSTIHNY